MDKKDKEKQNKVNEYFATILIGNCKKIVDTSLRAKMVEKGLYKDSEITSEEKQKVYVLNNELELLIQSLGYQKITEDSVILSKEEYRNLKSIEKSYDPFWFCSFGGCEGACKECKDTCEMSIFVKERKETAEKFLQLAYDRCLEKSFIKKVEELAKSLGVEIKE